MCLVHVVLLLIGDDFASSRKKVHDMKKTTYKMKKPLQAPSKTREHCFKITLWTSSGLSEV